LTETNRVGVIDIGSNSVRLVVFDTLQRSACYFYNEKVLCGLGADLSSTGRLSPEGVDNAFRTIARFAALAERMRITKLLAVATAAVRDAEDGPEFRDRVAAEIGIHMTIASGDDEARLTGQGVLYGWPDATGVAADLGGASLELVRLGEGQVSPERVSMPIGPLRLMKRGLNTKQMRKEVDALLEPNAGRFQVQGERLILIGGSWRVFARIHMDRVKYPLHVLENYAIDAAGALETAQWLGEQPADAVRSLSGSSSSRAAVTPIGAIILERLIRALQPGTIGISAFGLREGIFFENLPESEQCKDPFIESCLALEAERARFPGFGEELRAWLAPLFWDGDRYHDRWRRAACLLNDVAWRSHPDYRAQTCFETTTRATLIGISHEGRAYIGSALLNRYKGGMEAVATEPATRILSPELTNEARALGKAIRLGAMLSGSAPGTLRETRIQKDGNAIVLTLAPSARRLAGDVVDKRLKKLGDTLGFPVRTELSG
jgi:exopolyphosphatase / guanosine-5'-triphosphate,3'-diphosphate pyrophosphatase